MSFNDSSLGYLAALDAGSVADDQFGSNDGTLNSVSRVDNGGLTYSFGGSGQTEIGNPAELNFSSQSFSLACWVYATSFSGIGRCILSKWQTSNRQVVVNVRGDSISSSRTVEFEVSNSGPRSTATLSLDTWCHIACTHDATIPESKIYIDGSLSQTGGSVAVAATTRNWLIGARDDATKNYWSGDIDDILFATRVWSDAEVLTLAGSRGVAYDASTSRQDQSQQQSVLGGPF